MLFFSLKDLDCSYNLIKEIKNHYLQNLTSLITLNLRENQLSVLPMDVCDLKKLERLDMTNNGLLKYINIIFDKKNMHLRSFQFTTAVGTT